MEKEFKQLDKKMDILIVAIKGDKEYGIEGVIPMIKSNSKEIDKNSKEIEKIRKITQKSKNGYIGKGILAGGGATGVIGLIIKYAGYIKNFIVIYWVK